MNRYRMKYCRIFFYSLILAVIFISLYFNIFKDVQIFIHKFEAKTYLRRKDYIHFEVSGNQNVNLEFSRTSICTKDCDRLEIVSSDVFFLSFVDCKMQSGALPFFPNLYGLSIIESKNMQKPVLLPSDNLKKLRFLLLEGLDLNTSNYEFVTTASNIQNINIMKSKIPYSFFNNIQSMKEWQRACFRGSTFENECVKYLSKNAVLLKHVNLASTNINDEDLLDLPQGIVSCDISNTNTSSQGIIAMVTSKRYKSLKIIYTHIVFSENEIEIFQNKGITIINDDENYFTY